MVNEKILKSLRVQFRPKIYYIYGIDVKSAYINVFLNLYCISLVLLL